MRASAFASLPIALVFLAGPLAAQSQKPDTTASASAVRADVAPVIDGREDDAVWRVAPATSDFVEFVPTIGKAPRFRTEFKAAYDDRNLYVFVRAFDPHPDSIMKALTRRDVRGPSDQLKLMIDAYHDRRSGFEFAVNPVGVKRDYAMYNDSEEDESWDGVWDVGTRIDSAGWTAEFRIPFSQLRYANMKNHVFGFAVWRDIERYKERTSWPLYNPNTSGISSQIGVLTGIDDIAEFRRRELVPYVVMKSISVKNTSAPFDDWYRSQRATIGADLKYGITPNVTIDATVNPDFGQVEADPSVLNLSAFETFFQEKRPFFIEGTGLYNFGLNCNIVNCSSEGLFYSRRIGRHPQLAGYYGDEGSPTVTPILGAAKLTGRLASGLNIGVLDAVTGQVAGTEGRTIEPRTNYSVLRAQQELRQGATSIGFIATGVNRALDQWSRDVLDREAYAGGVDFKTRWGAKRYEVSGTLTGSLVKGTPAAMLLLQKSGVHNYQRPDDAIALDPNRTSLAGDGEELTFGKFGGDMVHFQTSYERQSSGYEVNDFGYLRRANQQLFNNWMGINWSKPSHFYRRMSGNFNAWGAWTADGLATERAVNTNWHVNFPNNTWLHTGATLSQLPGTYCDYCARGGPAFARSPFLGVNVGVQGDDRKRVMPMMFVFVGRGDYGASHIVEVSPQVILNPMSSLNFEISPDWTTNHDDSQWLDNITDATFGAPHYVFAHLDQETRSLGVRASYTATPTLSLQLYAAPFWTRGHYTNPRQLTATPRASRYEDRYAPFAVSNLQDYSFDFMQLRSNSVLRWEFRPGSTMFAVWQHGRSGFDRFMPGRTWRNEYDDLFGLHPDNTFLIKVAYWID